MVIPDDAVAAVWKFSILHGGEADLGLHRGRLCQELPLPWTEGDSLRNILFIGLANMNIFIIYIL